MGLLDGILGQLGGGAAGGMQNMAIDAIAEKFGIPPALAETAVAALAKAHPEPGDTVATAAQQTGIDAGVMGQIAEQLGGEGGLSQIAGALQNNPQIMSTITGMLDRDGDGNPINDIAGMAAGLFGKK